MFLMHLLLKERISLNMPFTLALVEVEVMVKAKEVEKVRIMKDNQIKDTQVVEGTSLEVGGVREIEVQKQIGSKMLQITESAQLLVRNVTCHMIFQRER